MRFASCFVLLALVSLAGAAPTKKEQGTLACTLLPAAKGVKGLPCFQSLAVSRELRPAGTWDVQMSSLSKLTFTETRHCLPNPEEAEGHDATGKWTCADMVFYTTYTEVSPAGAKDTSGVVFDNICPFAPPGYDTVLAYNFDLVKDGKDIILKTDPKDTGPWKPYPVARCQVASGELFGLKADKPSPPPKTETNVKPYGQCGGKSKCPKGVKNCVGAWAGYRCTNGFKCATSNAWYSQCKPNQADARRNGIEASRRLLRF